MTLIAAFYINNHPVLIGDVLISCPDPSQLINIPTHENLKISPPEDLWRGVSGLRQKVNIISSNLMVAWCGDWCAAHTLLKELKARSDAENFTRNSLNFFFESDEIRDWMGKAEVCFIGYIMDDDGIKEFKHSFNGAKINEIKIPTYGNTFIAGSGSNDLIHRLETTVPRQPSIPKKTSEYDDAVLASISICGALLVTDFKNILSSYGGSFEIATLNKQGMFEKVNDITYFQWWVSNCESINPKLELVRKAYKLIYIKDVLVVFTLSMGQTFRSLIRDSVNYTEFPIDECQFYTIAPCYYPYSPEKEIWSVVSGVPIDITSSLNCNHLLPIEYNNLSGEISFVPGKKTICKPQLFPDKNNYIVEWPNNRLSTLIIKNEDLHDLKNSYKRK
ncbi:hypothetical protein QUA56_15425 [Microcoleus sp. N3A4]|uniref:hypothetical protein n=1 Tax=Microcoleus sp. N3A4 TaxID=3055379 RepID=UPI002FCE8C04